MPFEMLHLKKWIPVVLGKMTLFQNVNSDSHIFVRIRHWKPLNSRNLLNSNNRRHFVHVQSQSRSGKLFGICQPSISSLIIGCRLSQMLQNPVYEHLIILSGQLSIFCPNKHKLKQISSPIETTVG